MKKSSGRARVMKKRFREEFIREYFSGVFGGALEKLKVTSKSVRLLVLDGDEYVYMKFDRGSLEKVDEDHVAVGGVVSRLKKKALDLKYFG